METDRELARNRIKYWKTALCESVCMEQLSVPNSALGSMSRHPFVVLGVTLCGTSTFSTAPSLPCIDQTGPSDQVTVVRVPLSPRHRQFGMPRQTRLPCRFVTVRDGLHEFQDEVDVLKNQLSAAAHEEVPSHARDPRTGASALAFRPLKYPAEPTFYIADAY